LHYEYNTAYDLSSSIISIREDVDIFVFVSAVLQWTMSTIMDHTMITNAVSAESHHNDHYADSNVDTSSSMICMAVVEEGPRIMFAAYNETLNRIILEECFTNGFEVVDIVERMLVIVQPTLVLVSSKIAANTDLLDILTTPPVNIQDDALGDEEAGGACEHEARMLSLEDRQPIPYRLLKPSSLDYRKCKELILRKLVVKSAMQNLTASNYRDASRNFAMAQQHDDYYAISHYHALASLLDFDSDIQIKAVGSLISFLQSTVFRLEDCGRIVVNDIAPARASLYMNLSATTISALHIFATEHHPLRTAKGTTNCKEGFSIFSLLDRTKSRIGRQRLRDWMLKPLQDVEAISLRQDGVELFCRHDLQGVSGSILTCLEKIGPIDSILLRIQKCSSKPLDFVVLHRSLSAAIAIVEIIQHEVMQPLQHQITVESHEDPNASLEGESIPQNITRFIEDLFARCHIGVLHDTLQQIETVIDEEATSDLKTVVVRSGFNEKLDACKEQYSRLDGKLL
jgi:hypothetical protein